MRRIDKVYWVLVFSARPVTSAANLPHGHNAMDYPCRLRRVGAALHELGCAACRCRITKITTERGAIKQLHWALGKGNINLATEVETIFCVNERAALSDKRMTASDMLKWGSWRELGYLSGITNPQMHSCQNPGYDNRYAPEGFLTATLYHCPDACEI